MAYQLIWEKKGLWARYFDTFSDSELHESSSEIYGHEQFDSIRYLLVDYLDLEKSELTERAVRIIADLDRAAALRNPDIMIAILTVSVKVLEQGFLYQDAAEGIPWQISYFDKIADARSWVGQ